MILYLQNLTYLVLAIILENMVCQLNDVSFALHKIYTMVMEQSRYVMTDLMLISFVNGLNNWDDCFIMVLWHLGTRYPFVFFLLQLAGIISCCLMSTWLPWYSLMWRAKFKLFIYRVVLQQFFKYWFRHVNIPEINIYIVDIVSLLNFTHSLV